LNVARPTYLDPLEKATCSVVLLATEEAPNPGRLSWPDAHTNHTSVTSNIHPINNPTNAPRSPRDNSTFNQGESRKIIPVTVPTMKPVTALANTMSQLVTNGNTSTKNPGRAICHLGFAMKTSGGGCV